MKKRILMVHTQSPGLTHYRFLSFAKYFKSKTEIWPEFQSDKYPNWQEVIEQSGCLFMDEMVSSAKMADVIVMQRLSSPMAFSNLMYFKHDLKKKVYCEIDDNVFRVDSSNPGFYTCSPGSDAEWWFKKQLEESSGVIVSTENLKEVYSKHNKKVFVVPNSIDFEIWDKLKKPKKNKKLRIGWQGALHHYEDLSLLMEVLPKIKNKLDVEFHFMGFKPDYLSEIVTAHPVVPIDKYPQAITDLNLDIILAPLQDTDFNRGKSNLRILEAGAMKKAVVATANKNLPYGQTIENGKDGYLASSTEEWVTYISHLIVNEKERIRLGENLNKKVRTNFDAKKTAKMYEDYLIGRR